MKHFDWETLRYKKQGMRDNCSLLPARVLMSNLQHRPIATTTSGFKLQKKSFLSNNFYPRDAASVGTSYVSVCLSACLSVSVGHKSVFQRNG